MRVLAGIVVLLISAGAACASGGLDCSAEDAKVAFTAHGGVTRGMGGPLFQFEGVVEIKDKSVADDLRKTVFQMPHVAQYWFDAEDLRLDLYREREGDKAHGYVELVIRTKVAGDEGGFEGSYELSVYDGGGDSAEAKEAKFEGKVSCLTE